MSREFGSYSAGYFHTQIEYAYEDLRSGKDEISREWSKFFHEFQDVAYAIASSEAHDSGPDFPISTTIKKLPSLVAALKDVERFVQPYKAVADAAVRDAIKNED